jgi:hypothetical protein
MKKIIAIAAMRAFAGIASAATVTLEGQAIDGKNHTTDQTNYNLTVKENITKNFAGDVQFSDTVTKGTEALSNRIEAGLTGTYPVAGINLYTRAALGEKFTGTRNFVYYSVEPGVTAPLGTTGLTARLGYRFRNATNDVNVYNDTTRTVRAGLSYEINKNNTVGVRFDQVRGDAKQDIWAVSYTRGF